MSIADLFDPCKNLKGAQTVLLDCYERAVPRYGDGQGALQAALSCYNTGNFQRGFSNGYVQKVASHVGVTVPALEPVSGGTQEPAKLQAVPKGAARLAPAQTKPREGLADAFSHEASGVRDAFNASDAFSENEEEEKEVKATAAVDQN